MLQKAKRKTSPASCDRGKVLYRQWDSSLYGRRLLKEKTVTISFRISEKAFKALQEDARRNNTSLNTLANQLFMTYAEHDRYLQKFHMIKISTPAFKRVLNASTDEALLEAGKSAGSSASSFILARMGEITAATAVEYLTLMGAYSNLFDYTEISISGRTSITLTHVLGANGSVFLSSYVDAIFRQAGKNVKITQFADGITIDL